MEHATASKVRMLVQGESTALNHRNYNTERDDHLCFEQERKANAQQQTAWKSACESARIK